MGGIRGHLPINQTGNGKQCRTDVTARVSSHYLQRGTVQEFEIQGREHGLRVGAEKQNQIPVFSVISVRE